MGLAELDAFIAERGAPSPSAPSRAAGVPTHPWVIATEAARRGELPSGEKIAQRAVRPAKLVTGYQKPENFEDVAALALMNTLPILKGGAVAGALLPSLPKIAPAVGRVATAVGLAKGRGEDNIAAAMEGVGAGAGEAGVALAKKALGSPAQGIAAIRERIGTGPDGPVNLRLFDSLLSWWRGTENTAAMGQRALRVAANLRDIDPSGEAARIFRETVAKGMKLLPGTGVRAPAVPPGFSQAADAALGPSTRAGVDAAMSADPKPGAAVTMGAASMNPMATLSRMLR